MAQVDFYILTEQSNSNTEDFACKITEKIFKLGHKAYIHTNSKHDAHKIDARLWSFRAGSFIPHSVLDNNQPTDDPITIGYGDFYVIDYGHPNSLSNSKEDHDVNAKDSEHNTMPVLINLSDAIPDFFDQFERITEIVDKKADSTKFKARERYQYYRDHGCSLNSHELSS